MKHSALVIDKDLDDVSTSQANKLLKLQRDMMEKVALGEDYQLILEQLCKAAEMLINDAVATIMVFDESGTSLHVLAAPSLPDNAVQALNGLIPDERAGSCGTAVYKNEPQFVFNTRSDLRWSAASFQQFIVDFSVGACWSVPIRINENKAIGSFALSSFEERKPSLFYIRLLETSAHIVGILIKRQKEQQQLWNMAHYDVLTGLPNRTMLGVCLQQSLENAQRQQHKVAVLFLDLDNFKEINDTQGHEVGDEVLKLVATNIKRCLRASDIFARLGGDEFVILIESFNSMDNLSLICCKLLDAVKRCNESINFLISTSIGISIYPDHGDTSTLLLRNADTAMYKAKARGHSNYHIYQYELTQIAQDKLQLSQEMSLAILEQQFVVYYQPQYDNQAQKIMGVEALVRWQHKEKGLVPPIQFIPIAEENGLIKDIGLLVLEQACKQCLTWWQQGLAKFILAVNVSVKQLELGFAEQIQALLQRWDFPFSQLELEVTESMIMQHDGLSELNKLDAMGIKISMDDFGTGHSSLAQLKCLPISTLKIDRCFVKDIPQNKEDITMTKTIIAMGHSLGLNIVAEGVETHEQQRFLAKEGCDLLQGYLLSKPIPAEKFVLLLKQQH